MNLLLGLALRIFQQMNKNLFVNIWLISDIVLFIPVPDGEMFHFCSDSFYDSGNKHIPIFWNTPCFFQEIMLLPAVFIVLKNCDEAVP